MLPTLPRSRLSSCAALGAHTSARASAQPRFAKQRSPDRLPGRHRPEGRRTPVIVILLGVFERAIKRQRVAADPARGVRKAAQRRASYVCLAFGLLVCALGLSAVVGLSAVDVDQARAMETVLIEEHERQEALIHERLERLESGRPGAAQADPEMEAAAEAPNRR